MISWSRVAELRDEVGEEDYAEIVELFLEETDAVLLQMRQCSGAEEMSGLLHFLKGSALNLGFRVLSEMCRTAELQASGTGEGLDLAAIEAVYDKSKATLLGGIQAP